MTAPPMLLVLARTDTGHLWRWHVYNWRTGGVACGEGSDLDQIAAELYAVTGLHLGGWGAHLLTVTPGWRFQLRSIEDPVSRAGPNGPPAAGVLPGVQAPDAVAELAPDHPPGHAPEASVGLARTGSTPGTAVGPAVPQGGSPDDAADLVRCQQCSTVIGLAEPRSGGRPRTYCSARCRQRAHRATTARVT